MKRRCPTCNVKYGELAFQRLIDGHIVKTRECIHCIAEAARLFHKRRRAREERKAAVQKRPAAQRAR